MQAGFRGDFESFSAQMGALDVLGNQISGIAVETKGIEFGKLAQNPEALLCL